MTYRKVAVIIGVLALVAAVAVFAAIPTFAQSNTPQAQATPATPGATQGKILGRGLGFFGGQSWSVYDAVAKALNLTPTQLFEQLHSGKTLAQVAQAQGVDIQTVQNAANAVRTQAEKDAINQAVKDGRMSQAQADWLLQGIDKGYLPNGRGFGFGGHGMRGGMHGFGGKTPATPSTPTTPAPSF